MTNIPLTGDFRVTCEFRRPGSWAAGWHTGIDLVNDNRKIYSSCNGVVTRTGYDKSYGNFIVVQDNDTGLFHWYCHLSKISVSRYAIVNRASQIGIMGKTGNATGIHLHYEIRNPSNLYGDVIDPADYMGIPNEVGSYNTGNYPIYRSHIQDIGWQNYVSPYHVSGTTGESKRIEAIQIMASDIEYRVHQQDIGWSDWVQGNNIAGITGESKRIEAIEFLSGRPIAVEGHVQDLGWQGERQGNYVGIGTVGESKRLEAFKFRFL